MVDKDGIPNQIVVVIMYSAGVMEILKLEIGCASSLAPSIITC